MSNLLSTGASGPLVNINFETSSSTSSPLFLNHQKPCLQRHLTNLPVLTKLDKATQTTTPSLVYNDNIRHRVPERAISCRASVLPTRCLRSFLFVRFIRSSRCCRSFISVPMAMVVRSFSMLRSCSPIRYFGHVFLFHTSTAISYSISSINQTVAKLHTPVEHPTSHHHHQHLRSS